MVAYLLAVDRQQRDFVPAEEGSFWFRMTIHPNNSERQRSTLSLTAGADTWFHVYLSLKEPSYEDVRHALLIAFTSREKRFRFLNVNIDDVRWPVGRMPAELCPDRGSDFMSASMEKAVVQDLRIDLTPL